MRFAKNLAIMHVSSDTQLVIPNNSTFQHEIKNLNSGPTLWLYVALIL